MPKPSHRPLKPNPFISLRDPETGKWNVVIKFSIENIRHPQQQKAS
ncbi:MAG: hypothetical protein AAF703_03290 [Cyanobacteria bacterium P01_D01_bin.105]